MKKAYGWIWSLPLLYFLSFYIIKNICNENLIITRVLKYYKVFANPPLALSEKDRLIAPVEFLLASAGLPDKFRDKAHVYLEKRIKDSKINGAKDLPQEVWTILGCVNKEKIEENSKIKISKRKIDYFYEEIIEGKKHNNFINNFSDWFWQAEMRLESLCKNFSFVSQARPDFTAEGIELSDIKVSREGAEEDDPTEKLAVFPEVRSDLAIKFGWVVDLSEYYHLAALEFQRRYSKHKFSKQIKKQHKYSDDEIFEYAQNWQKLDTSKIKLF